MVSGEERAAAAPAPPTAAPAVTGVPWLDLTLTIRSGMPVYPGDPAVSISPALRLAKDGVDVARLRLGSHTGTHVDAPAHAAPGGRTVDRLRLEELTGDALVLGFEDLPADAVITAGMVAALVGGDARLPSRIPARVLLATGWDRFFDDAERRVHHPVVAAEAADVLWRAGVRLLGVDTLSPDPTVSTDQARFPVHEMLLGRDGIIVENLTGLSRLRPAGDDGPGFTARGTSWSAPAWFGAFPLPVHQGDGAPARAVAMHVPGPGGQPPRAPGAAVVHPSTQPKRT